MDIEIFRLPSGELFLAAANQGRDRDMDSTIYKWKDGTFYPYQNISTDSAQHWEYFELDGEVMITQTAAIETHNHLFIFRISVNT